MKEARVSSVPHENYETRCRKCKRQITVKFNGGELDQRVCCGFIYELELIRIDFVVTKP